MRPSTLPIMTRTTSVLKPLDAGIIRLCKAKYKRMIIPNRVNTYYNAMDNDTDIEAFTLKNAFYMNGIV